MIRHMKRLLIFILAAALLAGGLSVNAAMASEPAAGKTVRVGYFTMENFMEGGADGTAQSGLTYELLCEIGTYNHWRIEYVYGDFSDLYGMLLNGEIDLLPNVIATDERKEQILFHDFMLNEEHYYISTLQSSAPEEGWDASQLNGKRLATVEGAFEETIFDQWALENGVTPEKVYCSGFDEAWEVVRAGKADYILNINNTAPGTDFVSLAEVGSRGVYFAVAPGREDLIGEISYAIGMLNDISPFLFSNLQQKYLNESLSSYQLSPEEKEWLASHSKLRIGGLKDDAPYAYEDGAGNVVGAYVEMTELIFEMLNITGPEIEWMLYPTIDDLRAALKNGEIDMMCPEYHSYYEAAQNGFAISEVIMNVPMGLLTLNTGSSTEIKRIATGGTRPGKDYVKENFPDVQIVTMPSVEELVEALKNGEADGAVAHIYALNEAGLSGKNEYVLMPLTAPCPVCYAALSENNELIMMMNRGYHLISQSTRNAIELNFYTNGHNYSLTDFVRDNLLILIAATLVVVALIFLAVSRSVSEKKLKERNVYLEYFLKSFNSAYIVDLKDNSFEILHMSENFQKAFAMDGDKKDMEGFIEKHIHPEDRGLMRTMSDSAHVMRLLETESEISFTAREMFGDAVKTMRVFIVRGTDNTRATVAFMDISDEIEKEKEYSRKLEAASKAKSTFLFNMSHDIRTPMNAIIGFNNIALSHIDDKETVIDSLNKIGIGSRQLLSLINDVLDMARIESGRVNCEYEPTDLKKEVTELMELVRQSTEKELTILEDFGGIEQGLVLADRLHTDRILMNIIGNSIKYTPEGGTVRFTVRQTAATRENRFGYDFIIEDNGIGMSREYLEHIYEEFSREKTSTASGVQGTGLGMAITKKLVDLLGGSIDIESKPGEGTKTVIHLEMEGAEPAQDAPAEASEADGSVLKGKKILLVEDNELNREIAEEILSDEGMTVDTAEDGDIAVEKVKSSRPGQYDLILMDVQMPRMNGYEATRAIRALPDERLSRIPIVAMTANAFEEDKQNALNAGMNGHLSKPVDVPKMIAVLSGILGKGGNDAASDS